MTPTSRPSVNLFVAFLLSSFAIPHSSSSAQPNILLFLADDLGYADIGVNGCQDIPTPHIDSIAKNGVRFTDGYATHPVCSPSRAGLMSGMYQHRFGFEHNSGPERYASPDFGMPREVPSLAEKEEVGVRPFAPESSGFRRPSGAGDACRKVQAPSELRI